jgi:soluble lytic murein transglycosylase-like protein
LPDVSAAAAQEPARLPRVEVPRGLAPPANTPTPTQALRLGSPRPALPAAVADSPANPADWHLRRPAILAAEEEFGIPRHLLLAIGRAETGRRHPATGRIEPWPWAVNVEGVGYYLASREEAVAFVVAARRAGRSIDIGCLQVNLSHHPQAFADLAEGFDPVANARYAARFLRALHDRLGGWLPAIGAYHSATEGRAEPYRARVLAHWAAEGGEAALAGVAQAARETALLRSLARWAGVSVVTPAATASGDPPAQHGMRVIGPGR